MPAAVFKIAGCVLLCAGLILVVNPELITKKPIPADIFQAVERRIWWGLIVGVGILLLGHSQWLPWLTTFAATGCALMLGLLIARLIGIALDGSVARQWLSVAIEVVILVPLVWWYVKIR